MNTKSTFYLECLFILSIIIAFIFLIFWQDKPGKYSNLDTHDNEDIVVDDIRKQINTQINAQINASLSGSFRPSLEMKENTDFLLTPALLVQEILSTNAVITYPEE